MTTTRPSNPHRPPQSPSARPSNRSSTPGLTTQPQNTPPTSRAISSPYASPLSLPGPPLNTPQKPIHSHNDYWRTTPLYTALSYGAISIEADVWLVNNTLLVGHDTASLTSTRTLKSLYIDPLLEILARQTPGGVFDVDPLQTLYLWIDIKTSGATTWPAVIKALQPLRDRDLLSNTGDNGLVSRQITIIGTGNAPYDDIAKLRKRDYFVDGNLQDLEDPPAAVHISPFASTSLRDAVGDIGAAGLTKDQLEVVKGQVSVAQWKGVKARYWDTPQWPKRLRTTVMRQLMDAGVGLLSVDDLQEAAEEDW